MHKIFKILAIVLGVIGVILWVMLATSDSPNPDWMFYVAYILLFIALAMVILYTVGNLLSHPAKLKRALIAIGALLLIMALGYVMSKGDTEGVTESTSKWVGTGLYVFYFLTAIAVLAMVWSGFKKLTNK